MNTPSYVPRSLLGSFSPRGHPTVAKGHRPELGGKLKKRDKKRQKETK